MAHLLALLAVLGSSGAAGAQTARPNVVVLMTDDQTALSALAMPKLRSLMLAKGMNFRNMFVSLPLCCPSRASYLTGEYAHNHGVRFNTPPLGGYVGFQGQETTMPAALAAAGYRTMHIGKYLNGYGELDPNQVPPGWTDWYGSIDPWTYQYFGTELNANGSIVTLGTADSDYQTDVYKRMATGAISYFASKGQPFFLDVAVTAPHTGGAGPGRPAPTDYAPVPAPRNVGAFATQPLPNTPSIDEADVSDKPLQLQQKWPRLAATGPLSSWEAVRTRYRKQLESLLAVDDALGAIIDTLERTGQLANTYVIFTSDNGWLGGEHRIAFGKEYPYEESIRVPLIVRGPGVPAAQRTDLVSNVDLAPTILDAAGVAPLREVDGRSLLPLLRDPTAHFDRDVLLESFQSVIGVPPYTGIRTSRYVYVEYATGERELYDQVTDPYQLQNAAYAPSNATLVADLRARMQQLATCHGASCNP
jgi:N-acetylglucosamine-6-sulfatase